jgi:hypothetical protein
MAEVAAKVGHDPSDRSGPLDRHAGALEPETNVDPGSDQTATTPCPIKEALLWPRCRLCHTRKTRGFRAIFQIRTASPCNNPATRATHRLSVRGRWRWSVAKRSCQTMRESELCSHRTFERFCVLKGIRAEPIPRAATPTPDYKVWIGPRCYIVELKQLDPNVEDERQQRDLKTTGQTAWEDPNPGRRARYKVGKAKRQLTSWAKRGLPTLLILFNNTGELLGVYIDPYEIKVGMYGSDIFRFGAGWVSGGKSTITTSFSAVAVLLPEHPHDPNKAPYLVLYHNQLAAIPLKPECVARVTEYQYRWQDRRPDEIGCWVHAITGQCDEVFGRSSG